MRKIAIVAFMLLSTVGCASRQGWYGGSIVGPPEPKVEMSVVGCDKGVDIPPVPMTSAQAAISYPFQMVRARLTGEVLATANIEKDGRVSHVVVDHATQLEFGDQVIAGLPRCVFSPAKIGGVAVSSVVHCKIQFLLDDE